MIVIYIATLLFLGLKEYIVDSYDAYKYHQTPEYQKLMSRYNNRN